MGKDMKHTAMPIALDNITLAYQHEKTILDNLSLACPAGGFLTLIGPSGCGKTSILSLLAGLQQPDQGTITPDPAGRDGTIGYVFQDANLMPWATIADNVWLPLRFMGRTKHQASRAIRETLAAVGLEAHHDAYPHQLSGGMKMRASLARALITRPQLLLMDEPFAALDAMARDEMNTLIMQLWQRYGCTIVLVTHSLYEAAYLSERTAIMTPKGQIHGDLVENTSEQRGQPAYRDSLHFHEMCQRLSARLKAASAAA